MSLSRWQKHIVQLRSRHLRKKSPYFLAEGLRCCFEALRLRPDWLEAVICLESLPQQAAAGPFFTALAAAGIEPVCVSERQFSDLAITETPQGLLCLLRRPAPLELSLPLPFCLILDQLREPGNVGSILRSAWAVGLKSVWLTNGSVDVYAPKVIRAGMGAQFALDMSYLPDLEQAVKQFKRLGGKQIWCAMPNAQKSLFEEDFCLLQGALVIGNEALGVSQPELGQAIGIPMPGPAESLNAAQATTVFLFDALRRGIL
ncbi:MAG: RNA methyltransferase [Lentisphaeria bacterium]|jgi:TrmH family RNA methyltransferase|nr:RNA methyltransferase [Lentisphaeria bacterium]MDY0175865.1 RNA methyltransferase [Lentisphaeria bacterium]NLZ59464.1 RNA methyltransferase [Lentisphaerota bacterium]